MSGTILRRRDRTARPPRVEHYSSAVNMLTVIDEFTRRCMAVVVERRLNSDNVLHCLTELFVQHGPPDHIRSDNGSEFTAHAVRDWLGRIGVKTLYIEPGSPWENGYNESFNSKLRDEILNTEIFYTLKEAKVLIERCPCSAARVHHFTAVLSSCGTPCPLAYMKPRLYWAEAYPCSARGVHSRRAVAKSPLWTAARPFWKSALQLTPALPRSTVIVRHMVAVRFLIREVWQGMRGLDSVGGVWVLGFQTVV